MKRLLRITLAVFLTLSLFTACAKQEEESEEYSQDIFAMDTYMTITAYGTNASQAVDQAVERVEELDALLSTGNEESEIYQINQSGGGQLSETGAYLVERSLELNESTGGLFDIAIYPVMEAWGFPSQNYRVPEADELESLLQSADPSNISFDEESGEIYFTDNATAIDLGGIAKGYTSGQIMDIFRENGVSSGLVSLGGNVQVLGTKTDGSNWKVAIRNPDSEEDYLGVLSVADCAVITSGGYERYFEEDGVTYHHIIDPRTGYPADSGVTSSTVISQDGTLADGLSTTLYIMGVEEAGQYWREHSDEFDFILFDGEKLYVTEGVADALSDTSYPIEIVKGDDE